MTRPLRLQLVSEVPEALSHSAFGPGTGTERTARTAETSSGPAARRFTAASNRDPDAYTDPPGSTSNASLTHTSRSAPGPTSVSARHSRGCTATSRSGCCSNDTYTCNDNTWTSDFQVETVKTANVNVLKSANGKQITVWDITPGFEFVGTKWDGNDAFGNYSFCKNLQGGTHGGHVHSDTVTGSGNDGLMVNGVPLRSARTWLPQPDTRLPEPNPSPRPASAGRGFALPERTAHCAKVCWSVK
jgi:hypothetical protein